MSKKLFFILACVMAWFCNDARAAALPTTSIYELSATATAANANGGGFNPANANFSTNWAATSATGTTPIVSSASITFTAGDVNAWVWSISGSNWDARRACKITSVDTSGGTSATLDAAIGHCADYSAINGRATLSTTAGIATTASPTSGTLGIDYSRTDTARVPFTDLVVGATTTQVTSILTPIDQRMVGNFINITAGTNCTQGWSELVSQTTGTGTITNSGGTAASSCTAQLGGAISLGSSTTNRTDANFFNLATASSSAANHFFVHSGSFSGLPATTITAAGNSGNKITMEGYATYRGDAPLDATRPSLDNGANTLTLGTDWQILYLSYTSTAVNGLNAGARTIVFGCKIVNTSTTAGRYAIVGAAPAFTLLGSEIISYKGNAVQPSATYNTIVGNYIHDSDTGIKFTTGSFSDIEYNIIASNVTYAINIGVANNTGPVILNNTIFGGLTTVFGTGLNLATGGTSSVLVQNNIFSGLATGINQVDANAMVGVDQSNDFFNNTAAVANWMISASSKALDPQWVSVGQITQATSGFTTGSCTGSTLTVAGADFGAGGVVAGRDYLYIVSGSGTTVVGVVGISIVGTTTLTLDQICNASGTTNTINYRITTGRNFNIGTNLKALGYPGVFAGGYTTGYLDIGAVQRQEAGGAGGQSGYPIIR